jgi:hypothetical protein
LSELRRTDEVLDGAGARRVEGHREDREPAITVTLVDRLPDRQVVTAPSPRGPTEEEHLAAAIGGEGMQLSVEIGKREIRGRHRA